MSECVYIEATYNSPVHSRVTNELFVSHRSLEDINVLPVPLTCLCVHKVPSNNHGLEEAKSIESSVWQLSTAE